VGEAPPIFAQAAGANLVYVANEPPSPRSEAIVVPGDSGLKTVAQLKGKKIALNKGSNVHYLLVRAIEKAGLKYSDITPVYLPPADARAAFERGSVDAWVIWDPLLAAAEKQLGARARRWHRPGLELPVLRGCAALCREACRYRPHHH
jgi:sulfonate transport system substrate-binding protein